MNCTAEGHELLFFTTFFDVVCFMENKYFNQPLKRRKGQRLGKLYFLDFLGTIERALFFKLPQRTFFGSSLKEVITRKRGEGIAGKSGEIRVRKEENYEDQSNYQQCRKKPEKGLKR